MEEGAGANKVSEVLSEASCCRCGTSNFTKKIGLLLVQKADSGVWRQELLCGPEDS